MYVLCFYTSHNLDKLRHNLITHQRQILLDRKIYHKM